MGDRARREIQTGGARGSEPRQRERVEAEVALQMQQSLAGHLAADLLQLDAGQRLLAGLEALHVVELRLGVDAGKLVPHRQVGLGELLEH